MNASVAALASAAISLAAVAGRAQDPGTPEPSSDPYSIARIGAPGSKVPPGPLSGPISEADRVRRAASAASAGPVVVTIGDLEDRLARASADERRRYEGVEGLRRLARETLRAALLAAEAERRGLDRDPQVERDVRRALVEALLARDFAIERFESTDDVAAPALAPERRRPIVLFARDRSAALALRREGPESGDLDAWIALAEQQTPVEGAPHAGGLLEFVAAEPREGEPPLDPALRAALFERLSAYGEASEPMRTGGVWAFVVLAGEMAPEVAPPVEDRFLAGAHPRREEALRGLVARLRRDHLRSLTPEVLDGIAFEMER